MSVSPQDALRLLFCLSRGVLFQGQFLLKSSFYSTAWLFVILPVLLLLYLAGSFLL
jgi:hypothetical protein